MRFRRLRIAWSLAWGAIALFLCLLWIRSYWRNDIVSFYYDSNCVDIDSQRGKLFPLVQVFGPNDERWQLFSRAYDGSFSCFRHPSFYWANDLPNYFFACIPYWFLTLLPATITAVPWLPSRFSLRTLLIATTLVAVGLGLIVYIARG
jgi:hypothetical protein